MAGVGAAASIGSAVIGSSAAGNAADAQLQGTEYAANLQHQDTQAALDYQKQKDQLAQKNAAPWLQAGTQAITTLGGLMNSGGFPDWTTPFTPPDNVTEQNDPGFQFRLNEGQKAIQASAAASGNLLSGGTLKDLMTFNQGQASNEYGNVYNRALNNYNIARQNFLDNNTNRFNRYATLSGIGQTAATNTAQLGQQSANNVSSTLLASGQMIGNDAIAGGNARASGYINGANAINYGLGGASNSIQQAIMMGQLMRQPSMPVDQSAFDAGYNLTPATFSTADYPNPALMPIG